jgi:hypothetical protein
MTKNSRRRRGREDREGPPTGLSKYARKVEARETELEDPITPVTNQDNIREGALQTRGTSNYQYEEINERGVPVEIRYHRTAIKVVCTAQGRKIYSVFFRPEAEYIFSIKQAGRPSGGKGNVMGEQFFEALSQAWWIENSPQAQAELKAIKGAFEKRATEISRHLGLEFSLG